MERFPSFRAVDQSQENPEALLHKKMQGEDTSAIETTKEYSPEMRREHFFSLYVTNELLTNFEDDLLESGFDEGDVLAILDELSALSTEDLWRCLSYPREVRSTLLERGLERIEAGELTPAEMVQGMLNNAKKHGFSVGFHTSSAEIRPTADGQWIVRGTERDHRDDDLSMAYYARTYKTLYRKRSPQHLYLVRVSDGDRNDGNWWRAPSLSIIDALPLTQMEDFIRDMHVAKNGKSDSPMSETSDGRS